jgi:hypothetical protein
MSEPTSTFRGTRVHRRGLPVVRAGKYLLCGAVSTLALAWSTAFLPAGPDRLVIIVPTQTFTGWIGVGNYLAEYRSNLVATRLESMYGALPVMSNESMSLPAWALELWIREPETRSRATLVEAQGFPFRCLKWTLTVDDVMNYYPPAPAPTFAAHGLLRTSPRALKPDDFSGFAYRVIWIGFLSNTVFLAAAQYVSVGAFRRVRSFRRRWKGLCPSCAYPDHAFSVCPECGTPLDRPGMTIPPARSQLDAPPDATGL